MIFIFLFLLTATAVNSIVSIENIVTVIVGTLATWKVTDFIKNYTGLYGFGATLIAVGVSLAVAIVAIVIQMLFSGEFSSEALPGYAVTIFSTASIAYHAIKMKTEK